MGWDGIGWDGIGWAKLGFDLRVIIRGYGTVGRWEGLVGGICLFGTI